MTPEPSPAHLTHDELATPAEMHDDCVQVTRNLPRRRLERAAEKAVQTPPSIHFDDYPREVPKREIEISEAAAGLAAALHLHLD